MTDIIHPSSKAARVEPPFEDIKKSMLESYKEFRSPKGNQGTFAPGRQRGPRHSGYGADEQIDPHSGADQTSADSWSEADWTMNYAFGAGMSADPANVGDATELVPIPPEGILDVQGKWWTSDQAAVDAHDQLIAQEDPDYHHALISFTEARDALRQARVAREFFPVVVPASAFVRAKTKGKGKGKGKSKSKSRKKGKGKRTQKGKPREEADPTSLLGPDHL